MVLARNILAEGNPIMTWKIARTLLLFSVPCIAVCDIATAQPEGYQGVVAAQKPQVLFPTGKVLNPQLPLSKISRVIQLDDLAFTGPRPSHPFVLGNYAADGSWGLGAGGLQRLEGNNAALQLAWADQFELEGVMEISGQGGWFFLVGWDEGRGYALSNVSMLQSGSPWFLSEFRGTKAIEGRTLELDKFEWIRTQPFKLTVQDNALSLKVGRINVLTAQPLAGYTPGMVILGVYDTRYGPRPLQIGGLKIRALPAAAAAPVAADEK